MRCAAPNPTSIILGFVQDPANNPSILFSDISDPHLLQQNIVNSESNNSDYLSENNTNFNLQGHQTLPESMVRKYMCANAMQQMKANKRNYGRIGELASKSADSTTYSAESRPLVSLKFTRVPQERGWWAPMGLQCGEMGENNLGDFGLFLNCLLYFWGFMGFILFQNG